MHNNIQRFAGAPVFGVWLMGAFAGWLCRLSQADKPNDPLDNSTVSPITLKE